MHVVVPQRRGIKPLKIDEKIPTPQAGSKKVVGPGGQEVTDVPRGGPAPLAAVDNDGDDKREGASRPEMVGAEAEIPHAPKNGHSICFRQALGYK